MCVREREQPPQSKTAERQLNRMPGVLLHRLSPSLLSLPSPIYLPTYLTTHLMSVRVLLQVLLGVTGRLRCLDPQQRHMCVMKEKRSQGLSCQERYPASCPLLSSPSRDPFTYLPTYLILVGFFFLHTNNQRALLYEME